MAARPTDRIVSAAAGVLALGRAAGIKAARAAQPLVARAVGAVRTRVEPPMAPAPPAAPPVVAPAATPTPTPTSTPTPTPTPRSVAKNIAPHPPAPRTVPARKKPAPGAKLPVRKASPGSEARA